MDARTLADWIGHDATDYDLDTAAAALDGIDLEQEPDRAMEILAQHELHTPDEVAEMGRALLALARAGGGQWGEIVQIAVSDHAHQASTMTSIRVELDGETRFAWVPEDGTGPDVTALHDAWETAVAVVEQERREWRQAIDREQRALSTAEALVRKHREARNAAIRGLVASGVTTYRAAQEYGLSRQAVDKIVS